MGKTYSVSFGELLNNKVASPIRTRKDIILILLETVKYLLLNFQIPVADVKGKLTLHVDKMSRLIYEVENKLYSFCFPYSVEISDCGNNISRIYDKSTGLDIDIRIISIISSIINGGFFTESSIEIIYYEIESKMETTETNINADVIWELIRSLVSFECGYLRFDCDEEHENGNLHPLHHFDINYSGAATYKIGAKEMISFPDFLKLLDITTECHFIE